MAAVLTFFSERNVDLRGQTPTAFDSVCAPEMSIHCYLLRIRRYTKFDFICFIVAMVYLMRLRDNGGSMFRVTRNNCHRLIITALLVASKANDDVFHANTFMARCGGLSSAELNELELEFCSRLDWRLGVSADDLKDPLRWMHSPFSDYWSSWLSLSPCAADADDFMPVCTRTHSYPVKQDIALHTKTALGASVRSTSPDACEENRTEPLSPMITAVAWSKRFAVEYVSRKQMAQHLNEPEAIKQLQHAGEHCKEAGGQPKQHEAGQSLRRVASHPQALFRLVFGGGSHEQHDWKRWTVGALWRKPAN
eukprot:CAMPEP_0119324104 /NCGR_PEP_ID=MMETSP1333-20130426/62350_1 /TAXON_ID=418940 /ORGANISM="Scyphosphaera apsteinii, Strain RCC1455" /LENGTH=307 /DNA_ID=CAMNT_0007331723 /DNA_START=137 /DNA_END=1060 /DNA_ORIENTATION=+